jgi:ribonuclease VapC
VIVDTSALIAILMGEVDSEPTIWALATEAALLPAPARVEFFRVASGARLNLASHALALLSEWDAGGMETVAFTSTHADFAARANARFGKGNGRGGELDVLNLMVYAVAMERGEPLLFRGRDFAATDVRRHPASSIG